MSEIEKEICQEAAKIVLGSQQFCEDCVDSLSAHEAIDQVFKAGVKHFLGSIIALQNMVKSQGWESKAEEYFDELCSMSEDEEEPRLIKRLAIVQNLELKKNQEEGCYHFRETAITKNVSEGMEGSVQEAMKNIVEKMKAGEMTLPQALEQIPEIMKGMIEEKNNS